MSDLPHLASRLYGTPLLIARPKLETVLGVFERKLAGQPALNYGNDDADVSAVIEMTDTGIAIVPILGTLVRRSSYLSAASGLTSYHQVEAMAETAFADPEVRAVLLEIDSSGGEAGGVFDLAERLRALSQSSGKPLWAIADEAALSAAYALAVSAERIWLTRTAEVGSIGVVAVHVDQSAADHAEGLAYTLLHAGAHKVDGHAHAPLSESVATDIQADLDQLHDAFVSLVATRRRLPTSVVRGTEARVYRGVEAIKAGLADQIGTRASAIQALSVHSAGIEALDRLLDRHSPIVTPEARMPDDIPVAETRPETTHPEIPTAGADAKDSQITDQGAAHDRTAIATEVETRLRAELVELTTIASQAARLGVRVDPAQALAEGLNPHALRKQVLDAAASADQSLDIQANTPHPDAGAKQASPLVAATQKLIAQS
ncbi:S49 family peptidase [Lamprobacter modestohalophilus]|uniref:S49 family peptidase n=1 Tax=Lamprobacter modestohalophilus TaxID=1064514 RepID=UPI002ADEF6D2|nr:S49 family peptidase [Lamprobacter modestohalophilus]MEA1052354.1 S49 family peptidase [Lamprobacter modestohalophilus]